MWTCVGTNGAGVGFNNHVKSMLSWKCISGYAAFVCPSLQNSQYAASALAFSSGAIRPVEVANTAATALAAAGCALAATAAAAALCVPLHRCPFDSAVHTALHWLR